MTHKTQGIIGILVVTLFAGFLLYNSHQNYAAAIAEGKALGQKIRDLRYYAEEDADEIKRLMEKLGGMYLPGMKETLNAEKPPGTFSVPHDYTITFGNDTTYYLIRFDGGTWSLGVKLDGTVDAENLPEGVDVEVWRMLAAGFPEWKEEACAAP